MVKSIARRNKTRRRQKKTRRRYQKGGIRFRDIVTMENKDDFVGLEVEIKKIPEYRTELGALSHLTLEERMERIMERFGAVLAEDTPPRIWMPYPSGATMDHAGLFPINNLIHEPGFIADTTDPGIPLGTVPEVGMPTVLIYYPNLKDPRNWEPYKNRIGVTLLMSIPNNLRELADRSGERQFFDWYLQLKRNRANSVSKLAEGDFFTASRLSGLTAEATRRRDVRNTLNPSLTGPQISSASISVSPIGGAAGPDKMLELPPEVLRKIGSYVRNQPEGKAALVRGGTPPEQPTMTMMTVVVTMPEGAAAGDIISFMVADSDTLYEAAVPAGTVAGTQLRISVPDLRTRDRAAPLT